jgi:outer membrane putative beta-barrel porin/alpha-amylase
MSDLRQSCPSAAGGERPASAAAMPRPVPSWPRRAAEVRRPVASWPRRAAEVRRPVASWPRRAAEVPSLVAVLLFAFLAPPAAAQPAGFGIPRAPQRVAKHEPIFGIGPRTIWKNGLGFEVGLDRDKSRREETIGLGYHALYGITADWAVTAEADQVLSQSAGGQTGAGDVMIRSKYRFYRNDIPGGVFHAAVLGGVEFPTGTSGLSSESTDFFAGLSAAFEGRRWLMFGTGRYRFNRKGTNDIKRGNVFLYDVAMGLRPKKTSYYKPDLVIMAELNGQIFAARELEGREIAESSGSRLLAGFGAWITYRNWALKPGVQLPVYVNLEGGDLTYRFVIAVEFHI